MLRVFPALIGAGLTAMWVIGMAEDATVWLTWTVGIAAALSVATVGLIPEKHSSAGAAVCLALLTGDYLYAAGLREICATGDLGAVGALAGLISRCARNQGDGRGADDAALWDETVAALR